MTTDSGCPQAARAGRSPRREVIDDPAHDAGPFRRRAAAAVRAQPAAAADLQHRRGNDGATGWLVPDISVSTPQGLRARRALPLADRPEPRPDADAARLHRRAAGDRSQVPRAQQHRRVPGRRLPHLRHDRQRRSARRPSTAQRASAAISRPTASSSSIPMWSITSLAPRGERQDRHAALRHHPRRPAAQRRQRRADQPRIPTSRSPAGRSRACASTTCRSRSRSRCRRSTRASGSTTSPAARSSSQANSLVDHPHRGPGYAARLRQRAMGPAAADPVGPGGDADRLRPRRRLSYRRRRRARRCRSIAGPTAGIRARSARSPPTSNGRSSGRCFGGTQRLVPRVQLVLTPPTPNLDIPNEDARSVDLEDSNLFALNRFPGYDRWEDASRVTYGLDWSLERPNLSIDEHHRPKLSAHQREPAIFPEGTGLTDRFSDIVGRTRIRYGRFIDLTHRFRSTRTISPSAATRSTSPSAPTRPMRRSAISGSTATSTRRSRICATRKSCGSPAGSCSAAIGRSSARP